MSLLCRGRAALLAWLYPSPICHAAALPVPWFGAFQDMGLPCLTFSTGTASAFFVGVGQLLLLGCKCGLALYV